MPDVAPEVELLPDLEEEDLALVPVLDDLALAEVEPEPVVDDLVPLPDVVEEDETGRFDPEVPDFELEPEVPLLLPIPVLLLIDPELLPIDDELDELDDPDVLPDILPDDWFFSLSFIVKISWIYIVKK
ncbi:hypothetical protein WG947_13875 [Pontibacter sp. H259]|uniref:hypothetical protein n=1 Tax=Pontibacter sp. H259 TaxID=3133421 RepID=UPI0030BCCCF8